MSKAEIQLYSFQFIFWKFTKCGQLSNVTMMLCISYNGVLIFRFRINRMELIFVQFQFHTLWNGRVCHLPLHMDDGYRAQIIFCMILLSPSLQKQVVVAGPNP